MLSSMAIFSWSILLFNTLLLFLHKKESFLLPKKRKEEKRGKEQMIYIYTLEVQLWREREREGGRKKCKATDIMTDVLLLTCIYIYISVYVLLYLCIVI